MGWPNSDPEGWDEVCRDAFVRWLYDEMRKLDGDDWTTPVNYLVELFQDEHRDVFDALLTKVDAHYIDGATNDYFMAKYGGDEGRA